MKQQEVFKKIGGILAELIEQYEYLKTVDGQLNELELELFLANSNFLTDHVLILSKLNAQNAAAAPVAPPQVTAPAPEAAPVIAEPIVDEPATPTANYFEPLVSVATHEIKKTEERPGENDEPAIADEIDAPVPTIDLEQSSEDTYSFMHEDEPEIIKHELVLDEADLDGEDETYTTEYTNDEVEEIKAPVVPEPVFEQPKVEQAEPITYKPTIVQEPAKPEVLSINDRISAQMAAKSGVADQLHTQPITDLKQAINLNDKLLFIKDLFNGYRLAYSEAIEILNRFKSFAEAEQFLKNNYITKNHWDTKPETTEKFYAILQRRYA